MRLAAAGCPMPEMVSITGHRLEGAEAILEKHDFSRERYLGESAIATLEKHGSGTKV